jgi:hypothetical protein
MTTVFRRNVKAPRPTLIGKANDVAIASVRGEQIRPLTNGADVAIEPGGDRPLIHVI